MIKSAAASVTGSVALGLGAQSAPADDAPVSTDFAALLDNRVAARQERDANPAATPEPAPPGQTRQTVGNATGKKLPLARPDAAAAPADASGDPAKKAEASGDEATATDTTTPALPAITTPIVLPGLVVPVSVQMPQTLEPTAPPVAAAAPSNPPAPVAIKSTTESLAQAAAVQAIRAALPGAKAEKAEKVEGPVQQESASTAKPAADPALLKAAATDLPASPAKADGPTAAPATTGERAPAAATVAVQRARTDPIGLTIAPAGKISAPQAASTPAPTSAAPPAVTLVPGAPALAEQVRVIVVPAEQASPTATSTTAQIASAQAAGAAIGQATGRGATAPAAKTSQPAAEPTGSVQPAAVLPAQAAANAVQANAAAPRREAAVDAPASPAKAATAASDTPALPAQVPAATPTQPIFAAHDGQSFAQDVAPVTAAPATSAVGPAGHDFATLVDRLVEARDAASPASVHAAITHSEFGQVSLRFEQDARGLSVSMSSADPEFARAVQASSAQSQMSGENTNDRGSGAARQDTSGQQQTGSASSQSQSQAQSQSQSPASGRNSQTQTDTRTGRASGQPSQDADPADARGGIYA